MHSGVHIDDRVRRPVRWLLYVWLDIFTQVRGRVSLALLVDVAVPQLEEV